ncbi:hypothetical protein IIA95_00095 [Patescibacteria group bacterium]|nr:hypothetical protein [Patescibacteria group bacterium]
MPFRQITDFLKRFEKISHNHEIIEKEAIKWCESRALIDPCGLKIEMRHPRLIIKTQSMALKNSIFLTQTALLRELKKKFGQRAPTIISFK